MRAPTLRRWRRGPADWPWGCEEPRRKHGQCQDHPWICVTVDNYSVMTWNPLDELAHHLGAGGWVFHSAKELIAVSGQQVDIPGYLYSEAWINLRMVSFVGQKEDVEIYVSSGGQSLP
jgi:hypothetical protein